MYIYQLLHKNAKVDTKAPDPQCNTHHQPFWEIPDQAELKLKLKVGQGQIQ